VDLIADTVRRASGYAMWPLDRLHSELAIAIMGAATGLLLLALVRWCSPQALVARARSRMAACIYEMRLFLDSPRRVLAAQVRLIAWSTVYLVSLLPPLLIAAPPLAIAYLEMEVRYGLAPVEVGRPLVVRFGLADGVDGRALQPHAEGAAEITAPVLHMADEPALYVRVRVREPGHHRVVATRGLERWEKRIDAADAVAGVSAERGSGGAAWWVRGNEPPLEGDVESISLVHPARSGSWFGMPIPWWACWFGVATLVALGLRRRFGVAL
jgi:hypothetical protein